jgi:ketohexokinase/beta-glucosidase
MQDGAPSHRNLLTIEELHKRGIFPIDWPPYSPDLNPIEQLWDYMKDWIGDRYLAAYDRKLSYDQLREAVRAAWDAMPPSFLDKQIDLMQARCQAVIDAQGGHTPTSCCIIWMYSGSLITFSCIEKVAVY